MTLRLDRFLFEKGLAKSRTEAASLIAEGAVRVAGTVRTKPSFPVDDDTPEDAVSVSRELHPFVSRGGEKLAAALSAFSISPMGAVALDVGASSGGFTDCLLKNGASRVFAVDAGHGQLVPSLLADPRVLSIEGYNARFLSREDFPSVPDLAVMDVSFISATLIIPALAKTIADGAYFVCLVKPQFEVGREGLGKGGVVKDDRLRRAAVARVVASATACGLVHIGTIDSPILGGDGNREYLATFRKE